MAFKDTFQVNKAVSSIQDTLFTVGRVLLNAYVIFWVSVLLYGTFNFTYLPVAHQEHPVYFHFKVCENGIGICSFPQANLSLLRQEGQLEVFKRGQPYRIVLDMELPESDANKQAGMFMMEMQLYNREGVTVHSAMRSTSLHYKSLLLETLETLIFSPLFLFGYKTQAQSIHVEFFPNFLEHTVNGAELFSLPEHEVLKYNPAIGAVVTIHSHIMQLYTAKLSVFSRFSGVRYFLYYWPITSAVIGISWIFLVLAFIVLLSWFQFRKKSKTGTGDNVLAHIEMPWNRRRENIALLSPDEMEHGGCETLGARPGVDDSGDETSILSAVSGSESTVRLRRTMPDS